MAVFAEERPRPTLVELSPAADPAPLGLAAFALTTFMLSGHNASFIPDILWVGLALFYGGLVQLLAGMWEFRNRNVFGSTAFSTYGGFWLALGAFVVLAETTKLGAGLKPVDIDNGLAWFLLAFAIFNTYMMLWALRVNVAVFGVFLALEVTEILLTIGFLPASPRDEPVVPARRRLGRDRDCSRRLVRVGGRRRQRHGARAGAPGGPAALGWGAGRSPNGIANAEATGRLGWPR